ncbi:MAG: efflux RND transporter periplasmic adaptor subunit, partial [Stenotrophobium sp.]
MNNSNRKFGKLLLCVLLLIVIGLVAFWFMRHRHESAQPVSMSAENAARKPLYWYDPMAPQQHFDRPGKSPFMDMQLVPKYADEGSNGGSDSGAVSINPRMLQDLGLRTAEVERGTLSASVIATGIVAADERRIEVVQARTAGWVEQLAVRAQGDAVKRGELLAGIYSPDLLAAQQEYLLALNSGREPLAAASRARLQLFGMSSAQIGRVTRLRQTERRVDYYAPIDGYVAELGTRLGMQVTPGMSLFKLVDLSKVW